MQSPVPSLDRRNPVSQNGRAADADLVLDWDLPDYTRDAIILDLIEILTRQLIPNSISIYTCNV